VTPAMQNTSAVAAKGQTVRRKAVSSHAEVVDVAVEVVALGAQQQPEQPEDDEVGGAHGERVAQRHGMYAQVQHGKRGEEVAQAPEQTEI
jgi:hypothetical protein